MGYIEWNEKLQTGIDSIDTQHKTLIDAINQLYDAMRKGRARSEVDTILKFLAGYATEHFDYEEQLQIESRYPGFEKHQGEHRAFIRKFSQFADEFKARRSFVSVEILDFLSVWIKNHIVEADMKYVPSVKTVLK